MKYKFDGTIDGIFSCILRCFLNRENPNEITDDFVQLSLTEQIIDVQTDLENNKRIITALYKYCGYNALCDLKYAFRSGEKNKNTVIFNYIKRTFECRKSISEKFSEPAVMAYYELIKRICLEVHRFKGFVRFSESDRGIFYAHIEPDNDIVDLLIPHFAARFKDIPFAIHDVKRNKLAMHFNGKTKVINPNFAVSVNLGKNEEDYTKLWRTYYNSVCITSRKNHRLMNTFLPVRYHKHLTEKI